MLGDDPLVTEQQAEVNAALSQYSLTELMNEPRIKAKLASINRKAMRKAEMLRADKRVQFHHRDIYYLILNRTVNQYWKEEHNLSPFDLEIFCLALYFVVLKRVAGFTKYMAMQAIKLPKTSVQPSINHLVKAGLLVEVPRHTLSYRIRGRKVYVLTDKGRQLSYVMSDKMVELTDRFDETTYLVRALKRPPIL